MAADLAVLKQNALAAAAIQPDLDRWLVHCNTESIPIAAIAIAASA